MLPQILEHSSECGVDLEAAANPKGNLSEKFISADGHNNCSSDGSCSVVIFNNLQNIAKLDNI
jgi:hypothetical protein